MEQESIKDVKRAKLKHIKDVKPVQNSPDHQVVVLIAFLINARKTILRISMERAHLAKLGTSHLRTKQHALLSQERSSKQITLLEIHLLHVLGTDSQNHSKIMNRLRKLLQLPNKRNSQKLEDVLINNASQVKLHLRMESVTSQLNAIFNNTRTAKETAKLVKNQRSSHTMVRDARSLRQSDIIMQFTMEEL